MRLPGAERAFIDPAKVRDYLLSPEHPTGRFKANVFRGIGYSRDHWEQLASDILTLVQDGEAELQEITGYGQKYAVDGFLQGPHPRMMHTRTVWIILSGEDFPRFLTAFPKE